MFTFVLLHITSSCPNLGNIRGKTAHKATTFDIVIYQDSKRLLRRFVCIIILPLADPTFNFHDYT